jgi:hypothetical protein
MPTITHAARRFKANSASMDDVFRLATLAADDLIAAADAREQPQSAVGPSEPVPAPEPTEPAPEPADEQAPVAEASQV